MVTKQELIAFENWTVDTFNDGQLKSPVHLSGSIDGNLEDFLIDFFKQIKKGDWVATTYRSHYHALLKGVPPEKLKKWILDNKSIHFMDKKYKMFSSAIVGGTLSISLGIAIAIKLKTQQEKKDESETLNGSRLEPRSKAEEENKEEYMSVDADNHPAVYCFIGDMTSMTGTFHEVFKYAVNFDLPIKFIVECNYLSTDTPTSEVWGTNDILLDIHYKKLKEKYPNKFDYCIYKRTYPHYGTGKFVAKIWEGIDETKRKGF